MNEEIKGSVNEAKNNKYRLAGGNDNNDVKDVSTVSSVNESFSEEKAVHMSMPERPYINPDQSQDGPSGFYQTPEYPDTTYISDKKRNVNPIIAIVAGVLVVLVALMVKDAFHTDPNSIDGEYRFAYADSDGQTISKTELLLWGVDTNGLAFEIDGKTASITSGGKTADCDIRIEGDEVTIIKGDKILDGEINLKEETLTIEMNDVDLVFEKA